MRAPPWRGLPSHGRGWDLAVAAALALAVGPGPLVDGLAHRSLVVHMGVQHWMLGAAGALGARALSCGAGAGELAAAGGAVPDGSPGVRPGAPPPASGGALRARAATSAALALFLAWHLPGLFGRALQDPQLHALMHLCYLGMGAAAAWGLPRLPPFERTLAVLAGAALMGPLALAMVAGALTYPGYRPTEAQAAGIAMLVAMQLAWVAVALGPVLGDAWRRSRALRAAVLAVLVVTVLAGFVP